MVPLAATLIPKCPHTSHGHGHRDHKTQRSPGPSIVLLCFQRCSQRGGRSQRPLHPGRLLLLAQYIHNFPQNICIFPRQVHTSPQLHIFPQQTCIFPQQIPILPQRICTFPQQTHIFPQQICIFLQIRTFSSADVHFSLVDTYVSCTFPQNIHVFPQHIHISPRQTRVLPPSSHILPQQTGSAPPPTLPPGRAAPTTRKHGAFPSPPSPCPA